MSNISGDGESFYSGNKGGDESIKHYSASTKTNSDRSSIQQQQAPKDKKKRNPPGNPDPDAEVIALSPKTLMATNRFVCEICHKGFQRDQNLQLHRRGHNLPWKLRQRTSAETRKRVYVCPETCCVHHNPARALGDLTGIKKHYSRKHGEKKWKCDKCSKKYAVQADCKAHSRTCGTREYKCLCGTIFSRKDSFITHRAFCDALAEEKSKVNHGLAANLGCTNQQGQVLETMSTRISENKFSTSMTAPDFSYLDVTIPMKTFPDDREPMQMPVKAMDVAGLSVFSSSLFGSPRSLTSPPSRLQLSKNSSTGFSGYNDSNSKGQQEAPNLSATALLQKAAQIGANMSSSTSPAMGGRGSTPNAAPFSHNAMLKHLTDIQTYGIINSYMNMVEQRRMQETSASDRFHDTGSNQDENSRMSSLGTYNCLFDQNLEFLNNIYGPYSTNDDTIMKGRNQAGIDAPKGHTSACLRKSEGSCGSNDSNFMTLDLLGTGGFGHAVFDGMQQQEMDFEAAKAVEDANFGCVSAAYDSRNN